MNIQDMTIEEFLAIKKQSGGGSAKGSRNVKKSALRAANLKTGENQVLAAIAVDNIEQDVYFELVADNSAGTTEQNYFWGGGVLSPQRVRDGLKKFPYGVPYGKNAHDFYTELAKTDNIIIGLMEWESKKGIYLNEPCLWSHSISDADTPKVQMRFDKSGISDSGTVQTRSRLTYKKRIVMTGRKYMTLTVPAGDVHTLRFYPISQERAIIAG